MGKGGYGAAQKARRDTNNYANTGNIKVPSKGYNLDNLGPDAYAGGSE
jgi:hypothetical protein